jgi:hypothetical protein
MTTRFGSAALGAVAAVVAASVLSAAPVAQAAPAPGPGVRTLAAPPPFAPNGGAALTPAATGRLVQPVARHGFKAAPPGTVRSGQRVAADDVLWAGVRQDQDGESDGLFGFLTVARPTLAAEDYHSLGELAAESANLKQIVEVGWTVDRGLFNDDFPHLFVYHWVDGNETCYNGCGWQQYSANVRPGQVLTVGSKPRLDIFQWQGNWWIGVDAEWIGYFPGSLWDGRFTKAFMAQWFGEVYASSSRPCSDMGNGIGPNSRLATAATGIGLNNGPALNLVKIAFAPDLYNARILTPTSMRFGGPGAC